jgi:hypothetical protein
MLSVQQSDGSEVQAFAIADDKNVIAKAERKPEAE